MLDINKLKPTNRTNTEKTDTKLKVVAGEFLYFKKQTGTGKNKHWCIYNGDSFTSETKQVV